MQVMQRARLAEVIDRHDVRMIQSRQGPRLALEPFGETGAAGHCGRQYFQRHQAIQRRLARLIDRAHAALADEAENLELRKKLGDFPNRRRHESSAGSRAGCARFGVRWEGRIS